MGLLDWLSGKKSEVEKQVEKPVRKPSEEVKLLWSYQAGGDVWSVAIGDGYVAAGSAKKVYLFDCSGKLLWSYEAGDWVGSVAIRDGYVAAGDVHNKVYLFNESGKLLWSYEAGGSVRSVAIGDGYVAVGSLDDKVYLFDCSGKLLWSYEAGDWVGSLAIRDGYVAAGSYGNKVYLFDYSGKLLWSYQAGGQVNAVAIGDGHVAAGTTGVWDSEVYLFDYPGKLLWRYEVGRLVLSVAIGDGYVAAGSEDSKVYLFVVSSLLSRIIQNLITEANQIGCKIPQPKSLELFDQGKYGQAVEIAPKEINYIRTRINDFKEVDKQIKSAESAIEDAKRFGCEVIEAEELLNQARSWLSAGNYKEGITIAKNVIEQSKTLKAGVRPEIALHLTKHSFRPNYWEKVDIIARNTGTAHAKGISLTFSKEVEVKGLKELNLNIEDEQRLSIMLKPNDAGEIPLEVDIAYEDLDGKAYHTRSEFILSVGEAEAIGKMRPAEFTPPEPPEEEVPPRGDEPEPPPYFPEELLPAYTPVRLLGRGGFARVFEVIRKKDGLGVALKVPLDPEDPAIKESFRGEMGNWQRLKHGNIIELREFATVPLPFLEMELGEESLDRLKKPLEPDKAARLIFEVGRGLEYAHRQSVIHRDLKPSNILLKEGIPKISDWGLSRVKTERDNGSSRSVSPLNSAPEQHSPRKFGGVDERTDIFQLGIVLYELATGKVPFEGADYSEIVSAIQFEEPVAPSSLNPEVSVLEPVILKCLRKEKDERYQSVRELRRALADFLRQEYGIKLTLSRDSQNFKAAVGHSADLAFISTELGDFPDLERRLKEVEELAHRSFPEKVATSVLHSMEAISNLQRLCYEEREKRVRYGEVKQQYKVLCEFLSPAEFKEEVESDSDLGKIFKHFDLLYQEDDLLDYEGVERLKFFCDKLIKKWQAFLLRR